MKNKIRVVIADDSALMRQKLSDILSSDPDIEVIAKAKNGKEAIQVIYSLKPDVVTMDIEMPILNGLDALGYIMSEHPIPCIMISAFTKEGSLETIKALEFGAIDVINKPGGAISLDLESIKEEIISKVKIAAGIEKHKLRLIWTEKAKEINDIVKKPESMDKVFTIASSTGGTQALAVILPKLSSNFNAGILVVQHMPEGFTKSLAERLNWLSKISVIEAEDNMLIKPAQVIIAKGGMHMSVKMRNNGEYYLSLNNNPTQLGVRPNANILMKSAAEIFKSKTVGIVLTGMGQDGTLGAEAIKKNGGIVLSEDKHSCVVYGMPKSVAEAGFVDKVLPLNKIAEEMENLVRKAKG